MNCPFYRKITNPGADLRGAERPPSSLAPRRDRKGYLPPLTTREGQVLHIYKSTTLVAGFSR